MTDPALEKIVFHFRSGPRKGDVTSFIQAHITIGRAVDSDLVFDSRDDRNVSSHHAVIRFQNQRFGLVDSHSTNGTYINGERLERAILKSGDGGHSALKSRCQSRPKPLREPCWIVTSWTWLP